MGGGHEDEANGVVTYCGDQEVGGIVLDRRGRVEGCCRDRRQPTMKPVPHPVAVLVKKAKLTGRALTRAVGSQSSCREKKSTSKASSMLTVYSTRSSTPPTFHERKMRL